MQQLIRQTLLSTGRPSYQNTSASWHDCCCSWKNVWVQNTSKPAKCLLASRACLAGSLAGVLLHKPPSPQAFGFFFVCRCGDVVWHACKCSATTAQAPSDVMRSSAPQLPRSLILLPKLHATLLKYSNVSRLQDKYCCYINHAISYVAFN